MLKPETAARKDRTQPTEANFQHRHFAEIARIIRSQHLGAMPRSRAEVDSWAHLFADELAASNPRFDRKRFLAACK